VVISQSKQDDEISPFVALLTIHPNFARSQATSDLNAPSNSEMVRAEFIFLLDLSGSMSGSRIDMAK